jgi:hypothetical protein
MPQNEIIGIPENCLKLKSKTFQRITIEAVLKVPSSIYSLRAVLRSADKYYSRDQ